MQIVAAMAFALQGQAAVLAYEKIFLTMGVAFTFTLPLLLFFRTGRVTGKKIDVH